MANPQAEPSMDDILASIRRIIAEEDEPVSAEAPVPQTETVTEEVQFTAEEEPVSEAVSEPLEELQEEPVAEAVDFDVADEEPVEEEAAFNESFDDVFDEGGDTVVLAEEELVSEDLELTEDENDTGIVIEAVETVEEEEVLSVVEEEEPVLETVAEPAAPAEPVVETNSMLEEATRSVSASAFTALEENVRLAGAANTTLEDVVVRLLEPMMKQWLDENLPRIVEEKVDEEVRRIARRR